MAILNTVYRYRYFLQNSFYRISGCIMASVNHYGEDIVTINNVTDYIECNHLCDERDECVVWTYVEGECYAKTQNTFKVRSEDVIVGYKDCKSCKRKSKLQVQFLFISKYFII